MWNFDLLDGSHDRFFIDIVKDKFKNKHQNFWFRSELFTKSGLKTKDPRGIDAMLKFSSLLIRGGPWDGSKSHWRRYCHVRATLRWLKIRTHSKPTFLARKLREGSKFNSFLHLRVFELEKVSHLKVLTREGYFQLWGKLKRNWTLWILSSVTFWAISRTHAYYKKSNVDSRPWCGQHRFQLVMMNVHCCRQRAIIIFWVGIARKLILVVSW